MKKIGIAHLGLAALGAALILGVHSQSVAQARLRIGSSNANFGVHSLNGGFVPDPKTVPVTSGGGLDIRGMNLGAGCVGFGTPQPDVVVNYSNAASFLRFYFQPNGSGDTSLVINDANGRWHCNDDTNGLNPQVDINNPPSGHYDIWVGSYQRGTNIPGVLSITELRGQTGHP